MQSPTVVVYLNPLKEIAVTGAFAPISAVFLWTEWTDPKNIVYVLSSEGKSINLSMKIENEYLQL